MPRIAEYIYYRPTKLINQYYLQIGGKKTDRLYYRGVFATLNEAIRVRDEYLHQ